MLEVDNISRTFGSKYAVKNLSFSVREGEVLGFIGPNGAGKTTSMRIAAGTLSPSAGTVRIAGFDIQSQCVQAKSMLGYLPENAPLYAGMTVGSFLSYIGCLRGLPRTELLRRVAECAQMCDIVHVLEQGVETLSKGYRHRVCLAQALLHDPRVLILDEPTDGLDPNQKSQVRQLIRKLGRSGKTIILSTHLLEEVEEVCSRVTVINDGRAVFDGSVGEFRRISGDGIRFEIELSGFSEEGFRDWFSTAFPGIVPELKALTAQTLRAVAPFSEEESPSALRQHLLKTLPAGVTLTEWTELEIPLEDAFRRLTRETDHV